MYVCILPDLYSYIQGLCVSCVPLSLFIVPNSTILGGNFTVLSNIIIKKQCLSFLIIFVNDNTIVCCTNHKQRKRDTSGFLKISENKM